MDAELLSRIQFAITVMFHMTFPAITVGISVFLCIVFGMYWRTRKPVYLQMFRFWRRIFAVGFALGVVAGIVITFELGLNWAGFAAKTGAILGPIIGMEVVTAFFVEASFLGVLLYGDGKVKPRTMFAATVMVAIGTILSSTWILVANSWMQSPAGYEVDDNGSFVPTDWWKIIFNPSFLWRWPHMLVAVLVSAAAVISGISAYYLIKNRARDFARRSLSIGLGILAVLMPVQIALGDSVAAKFVAAYQVTDDGLPSKLIAFEGHWSSTSNGYVFFAIPDESEDKNLLELIVPYLGSAIGTHDLSGATTTPGLDLISEADRPPVLLTYWGFRLMFYGSVVLFASGFISLVLRLRHRLYDSHRFHTWLLWTTPVGIIAILGGWLTAEVGRQPWVVWGELKTADAFADLDPWTVLLSGIGFVAVYATLLTAYVVFIVKTVRRGPERDAEVPEVIETDGSDGWLVPAAPPWHDEEQLRRDELTGTGAL
ncbi:MAG TPA: cytochrome ubiquinol oxidase subunit I [Cellulomonas sp.]